MRRLWALTLPLALALASLPQLTGAKEQIVTGLSQNRV